MEGINRLLVSIFFSLIFQLSHAQVLKPLNTVKIPGHIGCISSDPYQFVYMWWMGNIDPSTLIPPKGMKRRVFSQKVYSQGQYFHENRKYKLVSC